MKGLIIKDLTYIKNYWKQYLLAFVLGLIPVSIIDYDPVTIQVIILMIFVFTFNSNFGYDDYNNWNEYALTMPISRKDIVKSKYILALIFLVAGGIFGILISIIMNIVYKHNQNINEMLMTFSLGAIFFLVFLSIYLPMIMKFGSSKGKILLIIFLFTFISIIMQLLNKIVNHIHFTKGLDISLIIIIGFVISLILYGLSMLVSEKIMEKKEY